MWEKAYEFWVAYPTYAVACIIVAVVTVFVGIIYQWRKRNDYYWEKRGIPYEPRRSLFKVWKELGSLGDVKREMERRRKYGRVYGYFERTSPVLMICDVEILKTILRDSPRTHFTYRRVHEQKEPYFENFITTLNGEPWSRVRHLVGLSFRQNRLLRMTNVVDICAGILIKHLLKCADERTPVDCRKLFGAFTLDLIARYGFGSQLDSLADPDNEFVTHAHHAFGKNALLKIRLFFTLPPWLRSLFRINFLDKKSVRFFEDLVLRMIKLRESQERRPEDFEDFLQNLLIAHREDVEDIEEENERRGQAQNRYRNMGLSHKEIVAQCIMLIVVAYETSAALLSFVAYNLACHPEIQDRLIDEIDNYFVNNNGRMDGAKISDLKYLDQVIKETLRLQPPTIKAERTATENYNLNYETGRTVTIEKGTVVGFSIYAIHHDPDYFPDPEKFDPERFVGGPSADNRRKFLAFGDGERECLGKKFALLEAKLCIAKVLRAVKFGTCPQTKIPLEFQDTQGLLTPKDLFLAAERRLDVPQPPEEARE